MFGKRAKAILAGVCAGLAFNAMVVPTALATTGQDTPAGPPQPLPEWGEPEAIAVNAQVYETLVPGTVWDSATEITFSGPMMVEGQNSGFDSDGNQFLIQAFVVDEFTFDEVSISLDSTEEALWQSGNARASVFLGLVGSDATNFGTLVPVIGFAYSSNVNHDFKVAFIGTFDTETENVMRQLWQHRAFDSNNGITSSSDEWLYWYNPCPDSFNASATPDGSDCEHRRRKCGDEYDGNMRILVATFKAAMALGGTGCIVGTIMLGAFCLVGNPFACGGFSWLATRCAVALGVALATLTTGMVAARIAYEMCIGNCGYGDPGCP